MVPSTRLHDGAVCQESYNFLEGEDITQFSHFFNTHTSDTQNTNSSTHYVNAIKYMPSLVEEFHKERNRKECKDKYVNVDEVSMNNLDDIVCNVEEAMNRPMYSPCSVNAVMLPAKIGVNAMVDSCSTISIIDMKVLDKVNSKARRQGRKVIDVNKKGHQGPLIGVGKNKVTVLGTCEFQIQIGPLTFPVNAVVMDNAPTDVLIGLPEMDHWGLVPDATQSMLHFHNFPNDSVKMKCKNVHAYPLRAVVSSTTMIPARSQKIVKIQPIGLTDDMYKDDCVISALPIDECCHVHKVLVPNTLINIRAPQVIVTNHTNDDVTLSSGLGLVKLEVSTDRTLCVNQTIACNPLYDESYHSKELHEERDELDQLVEQIPPQEKEKKDSKVINYSSVDGLDLSIAKSHLGEKEFQELVKFVERNKELWRNKVGLGNATFLDSAVRHDIDVGDSQPIAQRPYVMGFNQKQITDEHTQKMLEQEVIEPSRSPWASPVVLAPKPNGGVRFCIDFRKLNAVTKKDVYPLPRMTDLLDAMQGAQFFSTLDLLSGYWQIPLSERAKEKTAFITSTGLYQWKVMPFGLCNAPASFQRMMDVILAGLKWNCSLVYLDDVIVFSKTFHEHLRDLQKVFDRLHESDLILSPSKCTLCSKRVKYLGHIVSSEGIECDPKKVESIRDFPQPTNSTEARSFVGLAGYYRRFIYQFSARITPILELTKDKVPFVWTEECEKSFKDIKTAMQKAPILRHPNFKKPFILDTDACKHGLGAVLMQVDDEGREYVIAYASKKLTEGESKWSTTEHEAFAIVWAVDCFRPYLLGSEFLVRTDHKSLTWLNQSKNSRLIRWALRLEEFKFDITHRSGKKHQHADALSRAPVGESSVDVHVDGLPEEERMNGPETRVYWTIHGSNHLRSCRKVCRKNVVAVCKDIHRDSWLTNSLDSDKEDQEPYVDLGSSESEEEEPYEAWVELSED